MRYIKLFTGLLLFAALYNISTAQAIAWSSEDTHTAQRDFMHNRKGYLVADKYDTLFTVTGDDAKGLGYDIMLRKYDNNGVFKWATRFNYGTNYDLPCGSLILDNFNNSYVFGESNFGSKSDCVLLKYDTDGNLLWTGIQDSADTYFFPLVMEKDQSGNLIILCQREMRLPSSAFAYDYYILKYDYNGVLLWKTALDVAYGDIPRELCVSGDNICVTGQSLLSTSYNSLLCVIMLNSSGVFQWQHTSLLNTTNRCNVPVVTDGTYFYVASDIHAGMNSYIQLKKFGSYGSVIWTYTDETPSSNRCIAYDYKNQRIVIAGSEAATASIYTSEISTIWGTRIWKKSFGSGGSANDIKLKWVNGNFNIYVLGDVNQGASGNDIVLLKYSTAGVLGWNTFYNGVSNYSDHAITLATGGLTDFYITGDCITNTTYPYIYNCALLRISPGSTSPVMNSLANDVTAPDNYSLEQNYPNPFNPSTTIKFSLPVDDNVVINVCDITGREVAELVNQKMTAGYHEIKFDGSGLSSGTYFYKITTSKFTDVKKMILVK